MTVICWDGVTLAADKGAGSHSIMNTVTKIYRAGNDLVGLAGDAPHAHAILDWLRTDRDPAKYPPSVPETCGNALVIYPDRAALLYEGTASPMRYEQPFVAIGIGRDFALAAMHLGCDARRAVEVACHFSVWCGNGIDVLRFGGV